jgi:hypothetical protein
VADGCDPRVMLHIISHSPNHKTTSIRRLCESVYLYSCAGRRAPNAVKSGEVLLLYVENWDLTTHEEHIRVLGKGNRRRTVLLDDPRLVK